MGLSAVRGRIIVAGVAFLAAFILTPHVRIAAANGVHVAASQAPPNLQPANALLRVNATGTSMTLVPDDDAHCAWLDVRQTAWGGVSVLTTALTGTSGLGTLAIGDNHQDWKVAIGISTVALGALGAISAFLSTHYGDRYKSYGCVPATAASVR